MQAAALKFVPALILAGVVVVFGLPVLKNGFVLDAERIVVGRELLVSGSFADVARAPWWPEEEGDQGLYRPVTLLLYRLLAPGAGEAQGPEIYNGACLILHALNAALRFILVAGFLAGRRLRIPLAFAAAALPALHAISYESVVGVVGAAELLAALFMGLSWLAFNRGREGRGPVGGGLWCFIAVVAWVLAFLSKETAVFFPLLPIFQVLLLRPARRAKTPVLVLALLLAVGAGGAALALRHQAIGTYVVDTRQAVHREFTTGERVASSLAVLSSRYLPQIVLPLELMPNLTHQDVPPPRGFGDRRVLFGMLIWLLLLGWLLRATLGGQPEALFLLFAILSYLPTSNLLVPIGALGAWRFLYSPLFGLAAAAALMIERQIRLQSRLRLLSIACFVLVLGLGAYGTPRLLAMWRDARTLYARAYEMNPNSIWALHNHATAEFQAGNDLEAFMTMLASYRAFEHELATLPDGKRLDHQTRQIAFRLLMNVASGEGTRAQAPELDPSRAADAAGRGVSAAVAAEAMLWDEPEHAFDARLTAFQLRQLEIIQLRRLENRSAEAESLRIQQAGDDLAALESQLRQPLDDARRIKLAVAAAEFGEMIGDRRLALRHLERAAEIDRSEPGIASVRARLAAGARDLVGALEVLDPVFAAGRAGIDQHELAARILLALGRGDEARRHRLAILDLAPANPVEAGIKDQVMRELGLGGGR
ncbi:MAG: hypothetical protein H6807_06125 [Planctomycetes bacterium]|nr:hypothetical protein [Planctomycetota bacterium]